MEYVEANFSECVFNPMVKKKMLQAYPQLKNLVNAEEQQLEHVDMVVRYILMMYDSKSPLIKGEKNYKIRRTVAAELTGLNVIASESFVLALYDLYNPFAAKFAVKFLQVYVKDRLWATIQSAEVAFWDATAKLMAPSENEDPVDYMKIQDLANARLLKSYEEFYKDASELEIAVKEERWTPEKMSRFLKESNDV